MLETLIKFPVYYFEGTQQILDDNNKIVAKIGHKFYQLDKWINSMGNFMADSMNEKHDKEIGIK